MAVPLFDCVPFDRRSLSRARSAPHLPAHALETREWTPLEPNVLDRKTYGRGVGELSESAVRGPQETLELVRVDGP